MQLSSIENWAAFFIDFILLTRKQNNDTMILLTKKQKTQLMRGEFKCLNLNHTMNIT